MDLTEENLTSKWGHDDFIITDEDIQKLKEGKKLFGEVQDEYSFSLEYKGVNKNDKI